MNSLPSLHSRRIEQYEAVIRRLATLISEDAASELVNSLALYKSQALGQVILQQSNLDVTG